ncbi:serine acetyltransferase [Weissella confusa]|uniref:Serine acetyltransferase n=2 Tax=Weissella confusa TaxID=1583 RepID=A0A4Z0RWV6_WEICO|nr:serine acetyltransferase [Weissella confusa]
MKDVEMKLSEISKELQKNKEKVSKFVILNFRLGQLVNEKINNKLVKIILLTPYKVISLFIVKLLLNIQIPVETEIGSGLVIDHPFGIVIHADSKIGKNVTLRHNVTIGIKGTDKNDGAPTIGDGVNFGAGSSVIGPVTLGDEVFVGAGAVVTKNFLESRSVLGGVPAKKIN